MINLELPWNPAVLEQRIGRIYRLGQKLPIDVYNLVCEQGIESRIAALVGSKQAFFKGLFDGDSDTVDFGQASNFLAKVQKLYEPAALEAVASTGNVADEDADLRRRQPRRRGRRSVRRADRSRRRIAGPGRLAPPRTVMAAARVGCACRAVRAAPPLVPRSRAALDRRWRRCRRRARSASSSRSSRFAAKRSGKVVIEAPAEAASTLGALFEGMAALLQSLSQPPKATRARSLDRSTVARRKPHSRRRSRQQVADSAADESC